MKRATTIGLFDSMKVGLNSLLVSHLQFADDTIFLGEASIKNALFLRRFLMVLELASGLRVNKGKCQVVAVNSGQGIMQDIADILGCKSESLPFKYLGLTVGCRHRKAVEWKYVVEKVRKRLDKWSKIQISLGGRITLIKSVLSAIPIYALSVFKAPRVILKKIISLQQQFLWGGRENARKLVWAKWDKLMKPKVNGGLGLRDLECFNKALLGKWAWKAVVGGDDLWLNIVRSSGGDSNNIYSTSDIPRRLRCSSLRWWDDIVKCLRDEKGDWFECNLRRIVGNGEDTLFWSDVWTGEASLKSLFPRFFSRCLNQNASVAQAGVWEGNQWKWNLNWRTGFREGEVQLLNNMLSLIECRKSSSEQTDFWKWEAEKSGLYSVRSSYDLLLNRKCDLDQSSAEICTLLWSSAAAAKAKATAWRVLFRKIATKSELCRRGVQLQNQSLACILCGGHNESVEHLFVQCGKVGEVWSDCLNWIGIQTPLSNSVRANFLEFCYLSVRKSRRKFLATLWVCVVWSIWKARNNIIFREDEWRKDRVFGEIKSFLWVWAKNLNALPDADKSFAEWSSCPW